MSRLRAASFLSPILLGMLLAPLQIPLRAQDPGLRETLQQAKGMWATQGDRDGAVAKFEQILASLEPKARSLDAEWLQVLCETYNWLAVLDDRTPNKRTKASKDLEAILDLHPDFEIDRNITNARLQGVFDTLRNAKLCKVKFSFAPDGGSLAVDGKGRPAGASQFRYLNPGAHVFTYAKSGYQPSEQRVELALKETKALDFSLTRISSTVSFNTCPAGVEVLLDGKSLGQTAGQAGPELRPAAEKLGIAPEQLSGAFTVSSLASGKHILELRAPCYRSRRIELGPDFATPFADHLLEPMKLEPSRGLLTLSSPVPGGELLLSGKSFGALPVKDLQVCAGIYDLQVRFPAGGFTQRVEIPEGKSVALQIRPKPRMVYVGLEGHDEFAGRERIQKALLDLGLRLKDLAYLPPVAGETPQDAIARHKGAKDAELVLRARPVPGKPIHQIELIVSTLSGEEERLLVKPLEEDPLAVLTVRLNAPAPLSEPWTGVTLLDLKGESGPWVIQADAAAMKAGIKPFKAITALNGKPVASVQVFRKLLAETALDHVTLTQGDANIQLAVTNAALELPLNASNFCYPMLLADLRLRYLGAKGDEAGFLRFAQALALMHFREYDQAMEILRDARVSAISGVSQGTIDYYTGTCLLRLGNVYTSEAIQAFKQALKYPQATLFGPEGPLVATLAKQALEDLNP
ncbi:MAG TPA: hypothetical protein PKL14_01510 [Holophaga sp.]|nr:hypothetical protein [Holophaga sp.]